MLKYGSLFWEPLCFSKLIFYLCNHTMYKCIPLISFWIKVLHILAARILNYTLLTACVRVLRYWQFGLWTQIKSQIIFIMYFHLFTMLLASCILFWVLISSNVKWGIQFYTSECGYKDSLKWCMNQTKYLEFSKDLISVT